MAFQRTGDNGGTYPALMKVAAMKGADERSVNEVAGLIWRLSTQSASHTTDYVLDAGTVMMFANGLDKQVLKFAVRAGLLKKIRMDDGLAGYELLNDPDFIHIRTRAEIEWERQQRSDTSNLALSVPIRARDGDHCRYCSVTVQWRGRPGGRWATLDHIFPGEPGSVATMVVACKSCNSSLRDAEGREHELLQPEPAEPYYSQFTAAWLTENGRPTAPTTAPKRAPARKRATSQVATATAVSDPAQAGPRTADNTSTTNTTKRPVSQTDHASTSPAPAGKSPPEIIRLTMETSSPGSGRDGAGVGSSSTANPPTSAHRRHRSPRGRAARENNR